MKPEHYIIIALVAICIYLWTDGCNKAAPFDTRKLDSLEAANNALKEEKVKLSLEYDSLKIKLNLSLSNTKPVTKKYEKKRDETRNTPADSLFIRIQNRSTVLPD